MYLIYHVAELQFVNRCSLYNKMNIHTQGNYSEALPAQARPKRRMYCMDIVRDESCQLFTTFKELFTTLFTTLNTPCGKLRKKRIPFELTSRGSQPYDLLAIFSALICYDRWPALYFAVGSSQ